MSTKDDKIQFLSPFEPVQTKGVERHASPFHSFGLDSIPMGIATFLKVAASGYDDYYGDE